MTDKKNKKITALKFQLERTYNDIRNLEEKYEHLKKYFFDKNIKELESLKNKIFYIKESIPDFDKEVYDKYFTLFQAESDFQSTEKYVESLKYDLTIIQAKIEYKKQKETDLKQQIAMLQTENSPSEVKEV